MSTAQVTARLGADATSFKSVLSDAESHAGKVAKGLSQKFDLRNLGQTMATALGLNLQNMGEAVARFASGMSKEMEQAFQGMVSSSDRATSAVIANIRRVGSENTQLQLLMKEQAKLQGFLDSGKAHPSDVGDASFMSIFKMKVGAALGLDWSGSAREEQAIKNKKALDEYLVQATNIQAEIDKLKASGVKAAEAEAAAWSKWVNDLGKGKATSQELTDIDKNRLGVVKETTAALDDQNKVISDGLDMTKSQVDQIKATLLALNEKSRTDTVWAMAGGSVGGGDVRQASDEALEEKVRRLRSEMLMRNLVPAGINDVGRFYGNTAIQNDISKIEQELDLRNNLRRDVARVGIEGARRGFDGDPLVFDRLVQEFVIGRTETQNTNKLLKDLNEKMAHGIPTFVVNQVRTLSP